MSSLIPPPRRLVLILPCCIGDVVLATATLNTLRRAYPKAHITWAIGSWSRAVVEHHPSLDAVLDTGATALPVKSLRGFYSFLRQLRAGNFDLAVSLVRSPLMSLAVLLSGIPYSAGLDSDGRGFGYGIRAAIDPLQRRHEADIYLDVARALGLDTRRCWADVPLRIADRQAVAERLRADNVSERYFVVHPGGGRNPGMTLDIKRWPAENFAALISRLTDKLQAQAVLVGAANDADVIAAVQAHLPAPVQAYAGVFSMGQVAALGVGAAVYIGNDTGLTHWAAAAGARAAMILGPSDPQRYAPFTPKSTAIWKPGAVEAGGVWAGVPVGWTWAQDGVSVAAAEAQLLAWLG